MSQQEKNRKKKFQVLSGFAASILLVVMISLILIPVHKAEAFPGEALAAAVWKETKDAIRSIQSNAKAIIATAKKQSSDVVFKNALRIYLTRIAQDTATYIATGGKGQKPLFYSKPFQAFVDTGNAAVGDYLDKLSTSATGKSLCDIGPIKLKISESIRADLLGTSNYCTNLCQKDFETAQNQVADYQAVQINLQNNLNLFQQQKASLAAVCTTITDTVQCSGNELCHLATAIDKTLHPTWEVNHCYPKDASEFDRVMTDDDKALGTGIVDDSNSIPSNFCSSNFASLRSCIGRYDDYINQQLNRADAKKQQCIISCTTVATAKCTLTDIANKTVSAFQQSSTDYEKLKDVFDPQKTAPGQYLFAYETAQQSGQKAVASEKAKTDYGGILPVTTTVDEKTVTPTTLTQEGSKSSLQNASAAQTTYTGSPLADAIGVFQNTLMQQLIKRIFDKTTGGYSPNSPSSNALAQLTGTYSSGGIAAAKAAFAKAFTPNLIQASSTNTDTVGQLVSDQVIDQEFADAVTQQLTVEEAVSKGMLHGDWWFGYNGSRQVPNTGNNGYPATSFPILRSNRILPVGWEIAAQYIIQYDQGSYTLSTILSKFDDKTSPFYHLVDPKWVLKSPLQICAKTGYGEQLSDQSCASSQVLQISNDDSPTCTPNEHDTNGDGKCDSNDPPIFENTCERQPVCVDQQTCVQESADGKGCNQYGYCTKELPIWRFQGTQCNQNFVSCQSYNASDGTQVSFLSDTLDSGSCNASNVGCLWYCHADPITGKYSCTKDAGPKIYLNNQISTCGSGDEGCHRFLRTTDGANLSPNGNFDFSQIISPPQQVSFDGWSVGGNSQSCGAQSFIDTTASNGTTAMRLQQLPACTTGPAGTWAQQRINTGVSLANKSFSLSYTGRTIGNACTSTAEFLRSTDGSLVDAALSATYTQDFTKYSKTVTFPAGFNETSFDIRIDTSSNCQIIVDEVKVEQRTSPTQFTDYGANNTISMKVAPASLHCTGNPTTDPAACANYTVSCQQQEVGCDAYAPVTGGTTIPAKVTDPAQCGDFSNPTSCDQCPAAFLGCKAFRELPLTAPIPLPNLPAADPRDESGIDKYVSVVPQSGKQCTAQYVGCEEYTNLNKASSGGESKEYYKQVQQCVSNTDTQLAYYYSWQGSDTSGYTLKRWHLKKTNMGGNAPCTNLSVTDDINAACNDTAPTVVDCGPSGTNEWPSNPQCVQFFDEFGGTSYRYVTNVIVGSEQCTPFRNSLDNTKYYFDPTESVSCPAEFNGCREYRGASANNTTTLLNDGFESSVTPSNGWTGGSISNVSTYFTGHSYRVSGLASKQQLIQKGKAFILSFWAYAPSGGTLVADFQGADANHRFTGTSPMALSSDWKLYTLGPVEINWDTSTLEILPIGGTVYIDNISLLQTTDDVFVVKGSAASCTGFENCSAYTDTKGSTNYLKGFSKLCNGAAVGCEALIDTHNSTSPFKQVLSGEQSYLQSNNTYTSEVPADSIAYVVNNPKKYCDAGAVGCEALGKPATDQNLNVTDFSTVYLRVTPDTFSKSMCTADAVGCQAYTKSEDQSQVVFFKNPETRYCEYRSGVGSGNITGWFIKGTNTPCPENATYPKSCPSDQSTCREYFSPVLYNNPSSPGQQDYFYLDSSLSKTSCAQGIDPKNGCLGFSDENAGNNTLRPKLDPKDQNNVLSQQCTQCSADAKSCGRSGNAPCCTWNPSNCSINKSAGTDTAAPYYCLYERQSNDFEGDGTASNPGCSTDLAAAFAVPNDATNPTNCGANGQPKCFQADLSDYLNTKRYCGDFACNANIVLPVTADRICDQWLDCTEEETVTRNGQQVKVCLQRSLRNQDRYIDQGEDNNTPTNLEKTSPTAISELANYSGLTKAGMLFTQASGTTVKVNGLFPYSQFTETGLPGSQIDIPNGDFEDNKISVKESPVPILTNNPGLGTWLPADTFAWKATRVQTGTDTNGDPVYKNTSRLQLEKSDASNQFSNQYLTIIADATAENGATATLENPYLLTDKTGTTYSLSFTARKKGVLPDGIRMAIHQDTVGDLFVDNTTGGFQLTNSWKNYVVTLNKNFSSQYDPNLGPVSIMFLLRTASGHSLTPGDGIQIDNVSLKPVLHISDQTITSTFAEGLQGDYYQAPTCTQGTAGCPSPTQGLYSIRYSGVNDFAVTNWSTTYANNITSRQIDSTVNFDPQGHFASGSSAEWSGNISIPRSPVTFYVTQNDAVQVYIDNILVYNNLGSHATLGYSFDWSGATGSHAIRIRYTNIAGQGGIQFGWDVTSATPQKYPTYNTTIVAQMQAALQSAKTEFPGCGFWLNANADYQRCIGGSNADVRCNSDNDCASRSCGNFRICNSTGAGQIVPTSALTPAAGPLTRQQVNQNNVFNLAQGSRLIATAVDSFINYTTFDARLQAIARRTDAVGVRWQGEVKVDTAGPVTFYVTHADGVRLWIDNNSVIDNWTTGSVDNQGNVANLSVGWHTLRLEYYKDVDEYNDISRIRLAWDKNIAGSTSSNNGWIIPADHLRNNVSQVNPGFIARNCRSYPQSNSLSCDYQDPQSGVLYRGFWGYCVERDPRDTRTSVASTACLNWWPVDVLAGDTDIFTDQTQSATRAPLYYCAEATGYYKPITIGATTYTTFGPPFVMNLTGVNSHSADSDCRDVGSQFGGAESSYTKLNGQPFNNRLPMVARIVNFNTCNDEDTNNDSDKACEMGSTRTGDCSDRNTIWTNVLSTARGIAGSCDASSGGNCTALNGTYDADNQDKHSKDDIEYINFVLNRWAHPDWYSNVSSSMDGPSIFTLDKNSTCDLANTNCWNGVWVGENANKIQVRVYFDANNKITSFYVYMYDGNDGGGAWIEPIFHMRSICTSLAQVTTPTGQSTAWAAKVSGAYSAHPLLYTNATQCSPFGATPVINTPDDVKVCQLKATATDAQRAIGCDSLCSNNYCEYKQIPMEIYTPGNRSFDGVNSICSQTILGAGFYSCGATGACKVCADGSNRGLACFRDADCPGAADANPNAENDVCKQAFGINETMGDPLDAYEPIPSTLPSTTAFQGIARLKLLFARSFGLFEWNDSAGRYVKSNTSDWQPPKDAGTGIGYRCENATDHVNNPNKFCGIRPTVSNVVVNGQQSGDVTLSGNNRTVNLNFNYTIDPEQTPLQYLTIDWGDGDPKSAYKSGSATKLYRCQAVSGKNCTACFGDGQLQTQNDGTQACVYSNYPRIQVHDNWDWCNIRSGVSAFGCSTDSGNWDWYANRIIVKP